MIDGLRVSTERFLQNIALLQKRSETAQRQITSGLKVSRASDNPDVIHRLAQARTSLEAVAQVRQNLVRVKVEVDTAEQALQQAALVMDQALALAAQGTSGHQSASTRRHVAEQLGAVLERLVSVSATTVEGRYIFSGDSDSTPPFEFLPGSEPPVSVYAGTPATRQIADHNGVPFALGQSADVIFDAADPEQNIFQSIIGLRRALLAVDNPPDPPDPAIPSLEVAFRRVQSSSVYLSQHLASYGLIQNRVDASASAASRIELSLTAEIAGVEEADLAEAVSELQASNYILTAAFAARAQSPPRSLFDYLG